MRSEACHSSAHQAAARVPADDAGRALPRCAVPCRMTGLRWRRCGSLPSLTSLGMRQTGRCTRSSLQRQPGKAAAVLPPAAAAPQKAAEARARASKAGQAIAIAAGALMTAAVRPVMQTAAAAPTAMVRAVMRSQAGRLGSSTRLHCHLQQRAAEAEQVACLMLWTSC